MQTLVDRVELAEISKGPSYAEVCAELVAGYRAMQQNMAAEFAYARRVRADMKMLGCIGFDDSDSVHVDDLPSMQPGEIMLIRKKAPLCNVEVCAGVSSHTDDGWLVPMTAIITPKAEGDWVGTDADGYTSATLKARIMPLGQGDEWWAYMGGEWLKDEDGGPLAFPSARMAREQVERKRGAERG
jgi:hypothetical protein